MDKIKAVAGVGEVYYQAVDMLLVSLAGYRQLEEGGYIHDIELGKLKNEGTYDTAEIRNVMDYTLGGERTISGVPDNAVVNPDGSFRLENYTGLRSLLSTHNSNQPTMSVIDSTYSRKIKFANVSADGWTHPLTYEEALMRHEKN